jgi:DNA-binding response OmpR family regulator
MPINVVYLDDEEDLCDLFKLYLDSDLINVEIFSDENEAIQYCNQRKPSIIFIDYRLKFKTGIEVAAAIKSSAIKVLVTGEFNVDIGSHFTKVIEKPYKLAEIRDFIHEQNKT